MGPKILPFQAFNHVVFFFRVGVQKMHKPKTRNKRRCALGIPQNCLTYFSQACVCSIFIASRKYQDQYGALKCNTLPTTKKFHFMSIMLSKSLQYYRLFHNIVGTYQDPQSPILSMPRKHELRIVLSDLLGRIRNIQNDLIVWNISQTLCIFISSDCNYF